MAAKKRDAAGVAGRAGTTRATRGAGTGRKSEVAKKTAAGGGARRPSSLTLRAYRVGFGDCFLLTFHYARGGDRHVLIDFGSTGRPKGIKADLMTRIARDIATECNGKLHAVVATHRHKDHISGFATEEDGSGTGDIIRGLNPDVVVQPWTEDPDLEPDATGPKALLGTHDGESRTNRSFVAALSSMHLVAAAAKSEAQRLQAVGAPRALVQQLAFLGENNLANRSAVDNLMTMGRRRVYVRYGSKSGLETLLVGGGAAVLAYMVGVWLRHIAGT